MTTAGRLLLIAILAFASAGAAASPRELVISVAVSMKDVVEEIGRRFESSRSDVRVRYNFGASGQLAQQIEAGAPVDVFISAGKAEMDRLERAGVVVSASRRVFARNVLTVIKPIDSRLDLVKAEDLLGPRVTRIVIGDPRTVPAGRYAEESLRALGLWDRVRSKLVLAENVRQALDYVTRGEVDAGFVYVTDAATRGTRVREAFRPPDDTYGPVIYPVAAVKEKKDPALAQAFLDLLVGADGRAALARFGFMPPPPGSR
jgi:molybdate transport system substrate-binding protein